MPRISIGMPVFNGAKYIRAAIDSLLGQTHRDFELVISDNASTDDTYAICQEYASRDSRIRLYRQPTNAGAVHNFRFVLEQSTCDLFMWAACDDVWSSNWLEVLVPLASQHDCLAFGSVRVLDDRGKPLRHVANTKVLSYTGRRILRRVSYCMTPTSHGKANLIYGVVPKRAISSEALDLLLRYEYGGDMLLVYALLKELDARTCPAALLHKRVREGSDAAHQVCTGRIVGIYRRRKRKIKLAMGYVANSSPLEMGALLIANPVAFARGAWSRLVTSRRSDRR